MMDALMRELFTTGFGLLSLFTIAFTIVMGAYIRSFVSRKMQEDARAAERVKADTAAHPQSGS